MKRILIEAILDMAAFIDMADEDTIDEDIATERLEHLATGLKQMTKEERREFLLYVNDIASAWEHMGVSKALVKWAATFGEQFGLDDGIGEDKYDKSILDNDLGT